MSKLQLWRRNAPAGSDRCVVPPDAGDPGSRCEPAADDLRHAGHRGVRRLAVLLPGSGSPSGRSAAALFDPEQTLMSAPSGRATGVLSGTPTAPRVLDQHPDHSRRRSQLQPGPAVLDPCNHTRQRPAGHLGHGADVCRSQARPTHSCRRQAMLTAIRCASTSSTVQPGRASTRSRAGCPARRMSASAGTYSNVSISVTDGATTVALAPFSIAVSGSVNRAPTISGDAADYRDSGRRVHLPAYRSRR